jgi:serine/threonine protein kinase
VGRKLGAGSFGAILIGTDLETGKYVALKFVRLLIVTDIFNIGESITE